MIKLIFLSLVTLFGSLSFAFNADQCARKILKEASLSYYLEVRGVKNVPKMQYNAESSVRTLVPIAYKKQWILNFSPEELTYGRTSWRADGYCAYVNETCLITFMQKPALNGTCFDYAPRNDNW